MANNSMTMGERRVQPSIIPEYPSLMVKRISWAAVFGGVVTAMVTQLLLSVLGVGIGAGSVDPAAEVDPVSGLGIGAAVWFAISGIISMFAGGWMAGRLAGIPRNIDGALHGVLTWGLTTLLAVYLLTTAVGGLLSGAAGLLGKGISAAGQGAQSGAGGSVGNFLRQSGVPVDAYKQRAQEAVGDAAGTARDLSQNPQGPQAQRMRAQAGQNARQTADTAARGVSIAAVLSFCMMLLAAVAAALGGLAGRPRDYRKYANSY